MLVKVSDGLNTINNRVNFSNKMKVYSASKVRKSSVQLNETIRSNIQQLAALLRSSSSQSLSLSPSMQSLNAEEEAINLAKQFVSNLADPFQCIMLYPLVLDCTITSPPDPLLQLTSFPEQLHPLLTLYLYKCTSYLSLDRQSRKIIDLFYRYVNEEGSDAYEGWLSQENRKSLGQWFYTECISSFFQLIYQERQHYTVFLSNYLKYGLPYLFRAALSALRAIHAPPECDSFALDRIRAKFIHKYFIE